MLHGDMQTTDLWQSDGKIGIDGGAIFGGSVHGVIFNEKGIVQDIEYQNAPLHGNQNFDSLIARISYLTSIFRSKNMLK